MEKLITNLKRLDPFKLKEELPNLFTEEDKTSLRSIAFDVTTNELGDISTLSYYFFLNKDPHDISYRTYFNLKEYGEEIQGGVCGRDYIPYFDFYLYDNSISEYNSDDLEIDPVEINFDPEKVLDFPKKIEITYEEHLYEEIPPTAEVSLIINIKDYPTYLDRQRAKEILLMFEDKFNEATKGAGKFNVSQDDRAFLDKDPQSFDDYLKDMSDFLHSSWFSKMKEITYKNSGIIEKDELFLEISSRDVRIIQSFSGQGVNAASFVYQTGNFVPDQKTPPHFVTSLQQRNSRFEKECSNEVVTDIFSGDGQKNQNYYNEFFYKAIRMDDLNFYGGKLLISLDKGLPIRVKKEKDHFYFFFVNDKNEIILALREEYVKDEEELRRKLQILLLKIFPEYVDRPSHIF